MAGMFITWLTGVLSLAICLPIAHQTGTILGKVVDPAGAALPSPKISLSSQAQAGPSIEARGDAQGQFEIPRLEPGIYAVRIIAPDFREKLVSDVRVTPGQRLDLGVLRLVPPGCNDPGVICHAVSDDLIHTQGTIEVPRLCAVDIDEGVVICSVELDGRGTILPMRDPDDDFWIQHGRGRGVVLKPRNGTTLALHRLANWSKHGCAEAPYSSKDLQIDPAILGIQICVRTSRGRFAQIAFLAGSGAEEKHVRIAYTTWE